MFWRIACFCEPLCSVTALGTGTERWQKNHLIAGSVLDESESVGRCCVPQTPVCLLPPLLLPASRFRNQCGLLLTGVLHDVYRVTNSVLQTVVLCSAHLCVSPPLCVLPDKSSVGRLGLDQWSAPATQYWLSLAIAFVCLLARLLLCCSVCCSGFACARAAVVLPIADQPHQRRCLAPGAQLDAPASGQRFCFGIITCAFQHFLFNSTKETS